MKLACVNWAGAEVKVRVLGSSDLLEVARIALAIRSLKNKHGDQKVNLTQRCKKTS